MTLSFINKRSFGFSLFEILAAVLVLSLMIFSSYIFIPPKFAQSRDARRKSDLNRIKKALMEYYDVSGTFPETMNNCNLPLIVDKAVVLDRIPCDPSKKPHILLKSIYPKIGLKLILIWKISKTPILYIFVVNRVAALNVPIITVFPARIQKLTLVCPRLFYMLVHRVEVAKGTANNTTTLTLVNALRYLWKTQPARIYVVTIDFVVKILPVNTFPNNWLYQNHWLFFCFTSKIG